MLVLSIIISFFELYKEKKGLLLAQWGADALHT